jgi:hypothetical protein
MAILVKILSPPNFFSSVAISQKKFDASLGHSEHILLLVHSREKTIDISHQGKFMQIFSLYLTS